MVYNVILTKKAKGQLDSYVSYMLNTLRNLQAAQSVMQDAEQTKVRLCSVAGSIKLCENPELRELGYRIIHFQYHRYLMVYRIEGENAVVEGVYHELQDYENMLC